MQPTQLIINSLASLLAADTANLAAAAVKNVHLVKAPFTPSPTTDWTTMTADEADFDGYAVKTAAAGAQQSFTDPLTGERVTQLIEPAGGWHWETTGVTNLPQTIYGWVVTDDADTDTFGSGNFETPIELTAADQAVDIAELNFRFNLNPLE